MLAGERKNLAIPTEMVKLQGAIFGEASRTGELYVSLDRDSPGPYPCVVVVDDEDGEPAWKALIVALPADFDHVPADEPEIAAALGMVESVGFTIIRDHVGMGFLRRFEDSSQFDPPFAQVPAKAVGKICDCVLEDLAGVSQDFAKLEAAVRRTEKRLANMWGRMWSPVVLADVFITGRHRRSWPIVMNWKRWISETCDLEELTGKFHSSLGLPSVCVKKKDIDAFRQRLRYLCLPASTRTLEKAQAELRS